MGKLITATFIAITIITIISNLIFIHKYYVTKKYEDIYEAGTVHFFAMYLFFLYGFMELCLIIYNWI